MTVKPPVPPNKRPPTNRLLLLPQPEVHLRLISRLALLRRLEMESIAVALVLSINVDEHGEAFGDVAFGGKVYTEGLWLLGDGDEGLDEAVAVDGAVLFELETCFGPFDLAGYLAEVRHLEGCFRGVGDKEGGNGLFRTVET
jgi:hypothetical protein